MISRIFSGRLWRSPRLLTASVVASVGVWAIAPQWSAKAQSAPPVEECNQFAEVVNRNQTIFEAFEREINSFSDNVSQAETLDEIRAAASQYVSAVDDVTVNLETLATDLEDISFSDNDLAAYRNDYVAVVSGFNNALEIVSAAMAGVAASSTDAELSENLEAVQTDTTEAVDQIENLAAEEASLIAGVNDYCGAN